MSKFTKSLAVSLIVLGMSAPAGAQWTHWHNREHPPSTSGNLWSDDDNWEDGSPTAGMSFRIEQYDSDAALTGDIIMDVDYSAGGLGTAQFFGTETVLIQENFKADTIWLNNGGNAQDGADIRVGSAGTISGSIMCGSEWNRNPPVVNFMGGDWLEGNLTKLTQHSRQGGIIKVSANSGSLTPGNFNVALAPTQIWEDLAGFEFALAADGVAPITLTDSDPLQWTGGAIDTRPFRLMIDASLYTGGPGDIPLFIFQNSTTETDRMFDGDADNITITGVPEGWTATVDQTDSGVTLNLSLPTITWDGTDNAWNSEHWLPGPMSPDADKAMVVDSGTVNVLSDLSVAPGPAASLSIALDEAGGTVVIDPAGTLAVTGDTIVAVGGTLTVNGALSTGGLAVTGGTLGLGAGSMTTSPLAEPDLAEVMITVDGTLNAGGGVATIGDEENDLGVTNLTLADGTVFNWTFSSEDDYVDVFGEVTFAGALEIQLVDGGGTANNETVALFRALDVGALDATAITVLSPAGESWTWDTDGNGDPVFSFTGEYLVLEGLMTGGVPGDANGDEVVDEDDLALFEAQFGGTPGSADFDGDGDVDLADFATLRGNWGFGTGGAPDVGAATPEPATMTLLAFGAMALLKRRRY